MGCRVPGSAILGKGLRPQPFMDGHWVLMSLSVPPSTMCRLETEKLEGWKEKSWEGISLRKMPSDGVFRGKNRKTQSVARVSPSPVLLKLFRPQVSSKSEKTPCPQCKLPTVRFYDNEKGLTNIRAYALHNVFIVLESKSRSKILISLNNIILLSAKSFHIGGRMEQVTWPLEFECPVPLLLS